MFFVMWYGENYVDDPLNKGVEWFEHLEGAKTFAASLENKGTILVYIYEGSRIYQ